MDTQKTFPKKVVGYCRSCDERYITEQKNKIIQYINNSNELKLFDIYVDSSGVNSNRNGYNQMMTALQNKMADLVICSEPTRLHRHLSDMYTFINLLHNNGIEYIFIDTPHLTQISLTHFFKDTIT